MYDSSSKSCKLQSTLYSARFIFPCPYAVYKYKIMILWNTFSSEISWLISIKFHVDPSVEMGLRVCSNHHAPLTVMPIYDKIMIIKKKKQKNTFFFTTKDCSNDDPFISCNDRIGKMLHNICISAVAISLRWVSPGPLASCLKSLV